VTGVAVGHRHRIQGRCRVDPDAVFGTRDLLERAALREREGLPDGTESEVFARWGVTGPGGRSAIPTTTETLGPFRAPDPWGAQHPTTGTSIALGPAEIGSTRGVPSMVRLGADPLRGAHGVAGCSRSGEVQRTAPGGVGQPLAGCSKLTRLPSVSVNET